MSPGYAMLSKFRIAAAQALAKDYVAAEESYLALSNDPCSETTLPASRSFVVGYERTSEQQDR